ncbi:MAG: hypothetical protein JRG91_02050 [Deltaproteobacteria bacterium]|nr:hypothetical protein [Deltaproteobacteria bacterium]
MKHATILSLCLALAFAAGCDQDTNTWGDAITDTITETPGDTIGDTTPDVPADAPVDTPADTPVDTPADTPVDTPADTPVDTPADEGGSSEIAHFCNVVCIQCFGGSAPWMSRPADQCVDECIDDFSDCSSSVIPAILACPGGDDCPAGVMGFATCVSPYTCLLS